MGGPFCGLGLRAKCPTLRETARKEQEQAQGDQDRAAKSGRIHSLYVIDENRQSIEYGARLIALRDGKAEWSWSEGVGVEGRDEVEGSCRCTMRRQG